MDEDLEKKYGFLQNSLSGINNSIDSLEDAYDDLFKTLKESVSIDSNVFMNDELNDCIEKVDEIMVELINSVIPLLRNR